MPLFAGYFRDDYELLVHYSREQRVHIGNRHWRAIDIPVTCIGTNYGWQQVQIDLRLNENHIEFTFLKISVLSTSPNGQNFTSTVSI